MEHRRVVVVSQILYFILSTLEDMGHYFSILNRKFLDVLALFHGTMLAIHVVSSLSCP